MPAVSDDGANAYFTETNATTDSFSLKEKLTGQTGNNGTKNVEIMVQLKYLSNFRRTLEIPFWSENCVIVATNVASQAATFSVTVTKLYVPVVTLSTQNNSKLKQISTKSFNRKTK